MILYLAPISAEVQMNVSPDEIKKGMEPWFAWYKKCGKAIIDTGAPLGNGVCVDKKGTAKSQTEVTGYSILQAKDLNAAKEMVKDHPHLMMPKSSIEILEIMPMTM
jgi:hypothetical protein